MLLHSTEAIERLLDNLEGLDIKVSYVYLENWCRRDSEYNSPEHGVAEGILRKKREIYYCERRGELKEIYPFPIAPPDYGSPDSPLLVKLSIIV